MIITGFSKTTLEAFLSGKPTFSLDRDFLNGGLPTISLEEISERSAFLTRIENYNFEDMLERAEQAIGYLLSERWPSLTLPEDLEGLSIDGWVEKLSQELTFASTKAEVDMVVWERLNQSSVDRLSEALYQTQTRLRRLSSRKLLMRNLFDSKSRRNSTAIH